MPYAYEYLTVHQKNSLTQIRIEKYDDNIKLTLRLNSSTGELYHNILYNNFGSAVTIVKFGNEESSPIELNFVDVCLEDLEILLKHHSSLLSVLHVKVGDCAKIFERLEMILKSRRLGVHVVQFHKTTVAQAMSILQYFDQSKISKVFLISAVDPENFENFRNELKDVEIKDDGQYITFQFDKKIVHSISPNKEIPVHSSSMEILARTVFENCLPMQCILRHLQCFDIERLRKVNRGIRDCIALIKPNPHVEKCCISYDRWDGNGLLRTYIELENGQLTDVQYFTVGNRVFVSESSVKNKTKSFPGTDYKYHCLNDVEKTLNHQMECIKELRICYHYTKIFTGKFDNLLGGLGTADLSSKIGDILRKRKTPLKATKLSMGCSSPMEVIEILPAIYTNSLKIIELLYPSHQYLIQYAGVVEFPFPVDQLSETVQWKNAEHLSSKYLTMTTPIQEMNVLHFAYLEILVNTLSSGDVEYLRTNLLNSSNFRKFEIAFRESTIDESLITLIGEPYRIFSDVKKIWYFRIANTDYYLHIVLTIHNVSTTPNTQRGMPKPNLITFTRVAKEDTPFFELPMNQLVVNQFLNAI